MSGIIHVATTSEEFYKAVQEATGGDRIELAPGDYGDIALRNLNYDENIVITSLDAENQATFNTVKLWEVSNVTFDNLFFDFTPDEETVGWDSALKADKSSNISVINSRFEGGPAVAGISADAEPGTQGAQGIEGEVIGRAMAFNWSQNIVIENNDISQFESGVRFKEVDGVLFNGNEIYDFRTVSVGGSDVSNLSMENNYFHDANPWKFGGLGDHGDFVHFWTSGPDAPVSENHYFANNIFDQGEGTAILGFLYGDNNGPGFRNVVIENNLIYNGNAQAITMQNVDGLIVRDNSLLPSSGFEHDAPQISLNEGTRNVVIENNILSGIRGSSLENIDGHNIIIGENLMVQAHDPHAPNYSGEVFVASAASVFDIRAVPGDMADGIGSSLTQFDWSPNSLTPQFQVHSDASSSHDLIFDASLTVGPLGLVSEDDAEFLWTFEDGSSATGMVVKHAFGEPGYYDVTLTVVAKDGSTTQAGFTAGISGDRLVQFDAQSGQFETVAYGEQTPLDSIESNVTKTADGSALKLGGDGIKASVSRSELAGFFGTDAFEMSLSLKADNAESSGEVSNIHTSFRTFVDRSGNFGVTLFLDDGSRVNVASRGIDIRDGNVHDITVRFDGTAGFADIVIDDKVVASEKVSGTLGGDARDLTFGNPWGNQKFEGELSAFTLSAESFDFPLYDGEAVPVPKTETNAPYDGEAETAPEGGPVEGSGGIVAPDPTEPEDTAPAPEDSGALQSLPLSGYELDIAGITTSNTERLRDDAYVAETQSGLAIVLDGEKDYVSLGRLEEFEASEEVAFTVDFVNKNVNGSRDILVWNHMKFGLTLEGDGLRVHANNADSHFSKGFLVDGLGLNDGSRHTATVMVDAEKDRLQVVVDDVLVLDERDTDFDFVGAGGHEWGWNLGTPWNRWFEGEIHDFQVSNNFAFFDVPPEDSTFIT
ncbi:right-handed parallel beta-helix repeat-containing protein [Roseovarius sp. S1116L3]|uniref:right-handed parallel beta-helix repeat-containing protein n=1 Tax=Roseovarius roseus TaxID=3342636 RepID=UPI003729BF11